MADIVTAVADTLTGEFQPYGRDLDARYLRVTVPRNPDPLREKYSGDPLNPIVAKSALEIAAADVAAKDAAAGAAFDTNKALKAVAISNLARALGKNPGAVTNAEISAERSRIIAIYKSLN